VTRAVAGRSVDPATRPAAADPAAVADFRRATRWLVAVLLPIGPAAVAVLRYVLPYDTVDDPATIATKVLAHPGAESLVIWLGFVAALTLVPAVLCVAGLTRRRAPRLTVAAVLLLVPAYLMLSWVVASDLLLWYGARNGMDATALAALYEHTHPAAAAADVIFVVGHVAGTVLLGLAMWHVRTIPRWAAVATVIAQPLHFVAAVIVASHPLDLVAWGLNAIGFAAAGVAIARQNDNDRPLPVAGGDIR
jgi:hypothetical protein